MALCLCDLVAKAILWTFHNQKLTPPNEESTNDFSYLATKILPLRMIKYTNQFLVKLEDLIAESDYFLRYEKGNFKSGYCLLHDQKIIIVNKFFTTEGKINILLEIIRTASLNTSKFSEKSLKLYEELSQEEVKL